MALRNWNILRTIVCIAAVSTFGTVVFAAPARAGNTYQIRDTIPLPQDSLPVQDTLKYPISDRRSDQFSSTRFRGFDLKDPANITDSIVYDYKEKKYYIIEKIGNKYYRKPTSLTFEEFTRIQARRQENDYFRQRANTISLLNRSLLRPKLTATDDLFNRLFGNGKIDIRPQGNVTITAGYQGQNIKNPTLPERARKNGGFDFDMAANLNVIANIGSKVKLPISYNTQSTFDWENQLKLEYTGTADEIIKKIELGNTSFASKGTLIPGAQSLFGIKTQLQFGKLWVTGVFATQKSQRQSRALQGGASTSQITVRGDDYDENRHFLLAQYFNKKYNDAMKTLPVISSQVQVMRLEVWVTNRMGGTTTDTRDIVGLMDIGEPRPFGPWGGSGNNLELPGNDANNLYRQITGNQSNRNPSLVVGNLTGMGLRQVQDFEKTFARKLDSSQYIYNSQLGYVSLNGALQPNEVLAVAFQYSYNGRVYQVGEFSQDIPVDSTSGVQKVLFLKLLKATSARTQLPVWDLMMKNIYTLKSDNGDYLSSLDRTDFQLNVLYDEPGGGQKRYLPEGNQAGVPLLTLLNLDRLNNQNDPQPDGVFDFMEGYTVMSDKAQIVFPVLEPFGRDLAFAFSDPALQQKYLYLPLYDTIKAIAQTYANLNRFVMKGMAKASSMGQSEISLNAFNVPQGSVTVSAGGRTLQEGADYEVNYSLGTVRILNQAILSSGIPVDVQFENQAAFGMQQRNYMGLRLDYLANKNLTIGATAVRLSERPYFTKMGYGEDPIRNTMLGMDFSYRNEVPRLNRLLDKLPFYTPEGISSITAFGEAAKIIPGHAPQIGKGKNGLIYIDDFEGTRASIDLRFPLISWALASTPLGATDKNGNVLFPEAALYNNYDYGKNRAKLAWYNIEPVLQERRNASNPLQNNIEELSDPRVRAVSQSEIFPLRTPDFGLNQLVTFDLAYYPKERGPYNYDATGIDGTGKLNNPLKRWGGMMRAIDQTDFETNNVEFIEFWILDPFIKNTNPAGGQLYFNLGNVSEDILKDGKRAYENGLPTPKIPAQTDHSIWGTVPVNPIQVTQAFSNEPDDRPYQDVGFDGNRDEDEQILHQQYLQILESTLGSGSAAYQQALADPSSDNFRYYRDGAYDQSNTGILGRYKNFNGPQGNSPVSSGSSEFSSAATMYPDAEDLNKDNTLNENEEYFQYRIAIKPTTDPEMQIGNNFIVDKKEVAVQLANGSKENQMWYQFRVPIDAYDKKIGNIPDFKSIQFIRMFLTGFEDSTVLRFAKLELVRNQWRKFTYELDTAGIYKPISPADPVNFNVGAVNIEENDRRQPVPYRMPPGIERVQSLSNGGINILQNEQSMNMQICNLPNGESRSVFKTMNLDIRQYRRLMMFIHAESVNGQPALSDGRINAVIRIGNDFINNFYEIKIPLKITPPGATADTDIWPEENNLDFDLGVLEQLKAERNLQLVNPNAIYRKTVDSRMYSVIGNPNFGEVKGFLVGIENPGDGTGSPVCTEVWINELRLSQIDEKGGWAALGRVDIALADLGTLTFSGNTHSVGFGALEQRVNERARDNFAQFDAAANLELGKLLPRGAGIEIPFYASVSQTISTPEYDPYDMDIKLKDKLGAAQGNLKDSIRNAAIDITTIKTVNFTNVRKVLPEGKRQRLWSISNLDLSYSYTSIKQHNPLVENNEIKKYKAGIGYNYTGQVKSWEPFKNMFKSKSAWLAMVRDFNLNFTPSLIGIRWDVNRQFGALRPREVYVPGTAPSPFKIPETYDKFFTFDRHYNYRWDISRSLNFDYEAMNNARIDEPAGRLDNKAKKDTVFRNLFKGGRNVLYNQRADLTYALPTSKLPVLDWTNANLAYKTTYSWIGASRLAINLGNTIQNSNAKAATVDLDFNRLYSKFRIFRALEQQGDNAPKPPPAGNQKADTANTRKKRNPNELPELNGFVKGIGKIITSVKRINFTYSEGATSFIPGYTDSTKYLGQNWGSMAPGLGFILGNQPNSNWLNKAAQKGLISKDSLQNNLTRQTFDQQFTATAQLEPVRDLRIDFNLSKTFNRTYSELFKDTIGNGQFGHLNPYAGGGFSISYIAFQTMFKKTDPNLISETFQKFQENRIVLSERLGVKNPYSQVKGSDGYYLGYSRYAQDVLIPSFIAAYTKKDPNQVSLLKTGGTNVRSNPFSGYLPKPNWHIEYAGLSRIESLSKIFNDFTLTHDYKSTLGMNAFNSNLLFQDRWRLGFPSFLDTTSNNFIPYFLVPNITIEEKFSPLLGVTFSLKNQVSVRFEYIKSRTLSLSLIDYQLSEMRSSGINFSGSWRIRGFSLPFNINLFNKTSDTTSKRSESDVKFTIDFSVTDNITSNSRLDQSNAFATQGQKVITINPTIDYVLSNRIQLKFYFDQQRTIPYISSSAPMVTTRAGVQVNISLAQ
ncbi:cell surface protein SprA [Agriterribacter sp.]|uniref:T9SS outer membrane translocon Sov/SprA n=1 Tax=Agriterribacter sp. TaxID=2821509 RepID=UPI002C8324E8|nr:cell surface protein SprA [Agriterribacter sp.]HTN07981.1 cell surface protein SprA [Agriterribacter sp.]